MLFFPSHCDVVEVRPRTQTGIDLADGARTGIPRLVLSPFHFPEELFRTVSPIAILQGVCPYRFLSRGKTGSSILCHDFGHLCCG